MKQAIITILFVLLLTGCTANSSLQPEKADSQANVKTEKMSEEEHDAYYNNPQVTNDSTLHKAGQSVTDVKGELTLKALNQPNKSYKIGDIEYTVREVKLLHYRPDYSLIDYFHPLTEDEEFDFIKISVNIQNHAKEKRSFAPIALFETSSGEKKDWEQDMYLENLNGEIEGNSIKRGSLGFIVDGAKSNEIQWIKLLTSDVFNEKQEKIEEAKEIRIDLK